MKTIGILVEGQTEEKFVKEILVPLLKPKSVDLIPRVIRTKIVKGGTDFTGGISKFAFIERDIWHIFNSIKPDLVTTMIDFYKFPKDMPGLECAPNGDYINRVNYFETKFAKNINDDRFFPYLQLHEFEALLFSSPEAIDIVLHRKKQLRKLKEIVNSFNDPEEINEGEDTAPSKRLLKLYGENGYRKTIHSLLIADYIGIDNIRSKCPHFNQWLGILEKV